MWFVLRAVNGDFTYEGSSEGCCGPPPKVDAKVEKAAPLRD